MTKVIAAFNMTLDGVCDHTTGIADDDLHKHYAELIDQAGVILYGRKTFELMKFWQNIVENPSGQASLDQFAHAIDNVPKIVFSNTIKETGWNSATLAKNKLEEEINLLKQKEKKPILIGSRSLIIQLLNSKLVDEFQICIHPVIEGEGLKLFDQITDRIMLKLINIKTLNSGAAIFYYEPTQE